MSQSRSQTSKKASNCGSISAVRTRPESTSRCSCSTSSSRVLQLAEELTEDRNNLTTLEYPHFTPAFDARSNPLTVIPRANCFGNPNALKGPAPPASTYPAQPAQTYTSGAFRFTSPGIDLATGQPLGQENVPPPYQATASNNPFHQLPPQPHPRAHRAPGIAVDNDYIFPTDEEATSQARAAYDAYSANSFNSFVLKDPEVLIFTNFATGRLSRKSRRVAKLVNINRRKGRKRKLKKTRSTQKSGPSASSRTNL